MGWMKVLQEYPFLEWSDAPIWIVLSQEHGRVLSNSADVGLGYWDATYEHHISCDHEFGMAAKWVVDIWSANTVFVKNCPFQSLLSTYSISFRRCKLHPLVLHRQNMESTVGAACNISTGSICSHGFSNCLDKVVLRISWICISTNNLYLSSLLWEMLFFWAVLATNHPHNTEAGCWHHKHL